LAHFPDDAIKGVRWLISADAFDRIIGEMGRRDPKPAKPSK